MEEGPSMAESTTSKEPITGGIEEASWQIANPNHSETCEDAVGHVVIEKSGQEISRWICIDGSGGSISDDDSQRSEKVRDAALYMSSAVQDSSLVTPTDVILKADKLGREKQGYGTAIVVDVNQETGEINIAHAGDVVALMWAVTSYESKRLYEQSGPGNFQQLTQQHNLAESLRRVGQGTTQSLEGLESASIYRAIGDEKGKVLTQAEITNTATTLGEEEYLIIMSDGGRPGNLLIVNSEYQKEAHGVMSELRAGNITTQEASQRFAEAAKKQAERVGNDYDDVSVVIIGRKKGETQMQDTSASESVVTATTPDTQDATQAPGQEAPSKAEPETPSAVQGSEAQAGTEPTTPEPVEPAPEPTSEAAAEPTEPVSAERRKRRKRAGRERSDFSKNLERALREGKGLPESQESAGPPTEPWKGGSIDEWNKYWRDHAKQTEKEWREYWQEQDAVWRGVDWEKLLESREEKARKIIEEVKQKEGFADVTEVKTEHLLNMFNDSGDVVAAMSAGALVVDKPAVRAQLVKRIDEFRNISVAYRMISKPEDELSQDEKDFLKIMRHLDHLAAEITTADLPRREKELSKELKKVLVKKEKIVGKIREGILPRQERPRPTETGESESTPLVDQTQSEITSQTETTLEHKLPAPQKVELRKGHAAESMDGTLEDVVVGLENGESVYIELENTWIAELTKRALEDPIESPDGVRVKFIQTSMPGEFVQKKVPGETKVSFNATAKRGRKFLGIEGMGWGLNGQVTLSNSPDREGVVLVSDASEDPSIQKISTNPQKMFGKDMGSFLFSQIGADGLNERYTKYIKDKLGDKVDDIRFTVTEDGKLRIDFITQTQPVEETISVSESPPEPALAGPTTEAAAEPTKPSPEQVELKEKETVSPEEFRREEFEKEEGVKNYYIYEVTAPATGDKPAETKCYTYVLTGKSELVLYESDRVGKRESGKPTFKLKNEEDEGDQESTIFTFTEEQAKVLIQKRIGETIAQEDRSVSVSEVVLEKEIVPASEFRGGVDFYEILKEEGGQGETVYLTWILKNGELTRERTDNSGELLEGFKPRKYGNIDQTNIDEAMTMTEVEKKMSEDKIDANKKKRTVTPVSLHKIVPRIVEVTEGLQVDNDSDSQTPSEEPLAEDETETPEMNLKYQKFVRVETKDGMEEVVRYGWNDKGEVILTIVHEEDGRELSSNKVIGNAESEDIAVGVIESDIKVNRERGTRVDERYKPKFLENLPKSLSEPEKQEEQPEQTLEDISDWSSNLELNNKLYPELYPDWLLRLGGGLESGVGENSELETPTDQTESTGGDPAEVQGKEAERPITEPEGVEEELQQPAQGPEEEVLPSDVPIGEQPEVETDLETQEENEERETIKPEEFLTEIYPGGVDYYEVHRSVTPKEGEEGEVHYFAYYLKENKLHRLEVDEKGNPKEGPRGTKPKKIRGRYDEASAKVKIEESLRKARKAKKGRTITPVNLYKELPQEEKSKTEQQPGQVSVKKK